MTIWASPVSVFLRIWSGSRTLCCMISTSDRNTLSIGISEVVFFYAFKHLFTINEKLVILIEFVFWVCIICSNKVTNTYRIIPFYFNWRNIRDAWWNIKQMMTPFNPPTVQTGVLKGQSPKLLSGTMAPFHGPHQQVTSQHATLMSPFSPSTSRTAPWSLVLGLMMAHR